MIILSEKVEIQEIIKFFVDFETSSTSLSANFLYFTPNGFPTSGLAKSSVTSSSSSLPATSVFKQFPFQFSAYFCGIDKKRKIIIDFKDVSD